MRFSLLTVVVSIAGITMADSSNTNSTTLFVSSYAGNITSLSLSPSHNGGYSLNEISATNGCAESPSWLTLDYKSKALYCLDEGLTNLNGSLSSFTINPDGSLRPVAKATTISGPVSGAIYGAMRSRESGKKGLALAHYTGSAVSAWEIAEKSPPSSLINIEDLPYTLSKPGAVPDRQDAPHEHEAIVDPTGQYVLVPDLGADLVRVFNYGDDLKLKALDPLGTVPGYGPRHAVFYNPSGKCGEDEATFLYVVGELSNNITGYTVKYLPNNSGLSFSQIYSSTTYGPKPVPAGNAAAEVALSPDNRFLVVSNRNNSDYTLPNPDPKNSTKVMSDSLSSFALGKDGSLTFVEVAPSGGSYPRHFSMNKVGNLVAVGLQYGSAVVVLARDVLTGKIGCQVAWYPIEGQVTCVRWNEPVFDGTNSQPI